MEMETISITVLNWQSWNPRKDYVRPTWFAMSNDLLDHPDFVDFTPQEFHAMLYILSQASKRKSPTYSLIVAHAVKSNITRATLFSVIKKLERNQAVQVNEKLGAESVQNLGATGRKEGRKGVVDEAEKFFGPKTLAEMWNSEMSKIKTVHGKAMPLVDAKRLLPSHPRYESANARLREEPSPEYWLGVITRIASSAFCRGRNDRKWVADFAFLIRNETHLKVLEGKYGDGAGDATLPIGMERA